jgi:hypothetical protein
MAYATNLPDKGSPRGLGELGHQAAGFGTWVVDMHWGLSPKHITGQNRPYGPGVIQTFYPRSQDPRLLNLSMGPVIPGGSWPDMQPTSITPVFRTPVARSGQKQQSIPPLGLSGMGYLPMGIAHPPTDLLERGEPRDIPYEQMPPMLQGYGAADDTVAEIGVAEHRIPVTEGDLKTIQDNPAQVRKMFFSILQAAAAARATENRYQDLVATLRAANDGDAHGHALQVVYGNAAARNQNLVFANTMDNLRVMFAATFPPEQVAQWPAEVQRAYNAFMQTPGSFSGFGAGEAAIGVGAGGLALFAVGAGTAAYTGTGMAAGLSGLIGGGVGAGPIGWMIAALVVLSVVFLAIGIVANVLFSGPTEEAAAAIQSQKLAQNTQSRDAKHMYMMQQLADAQKRRDASPVGSPARQAAEEDVAFWRAGGTRSAAAERVSGENVDAAGGVPTWAVQTLFILGTAAYAAWLWFFGGPKTSGSGSAAADPTVRNFNRAAGQALEGQPQRRKLFNR